MPIDLKWERTGAVSTYRGFITGKELLASVMAVGADARFDDLTYSINDCLGITDFDLGDIDLEDIAIYPIGASAHHKNLRIAYVAIDARILQILKQLTAIMDSAYPSSMFATLAEARTWVQAHGGLQGSK